MTADENVACAGLLQSAGSGTTPTTTFSKTTTIGASGSTDGLRLTTTNVTFPALSELITTNSANITISQTGTLIMEGTVAFDGSLTQTTSAPVHLSGTMTGSANAHAVSFAGAVTLTESLRIDTALVNENITFSNTVDGTYPLTLAAGGGNIIFATNVGSTNRIGALKIENAHDVTMTNPVPSTIKAASIYVGSTAPVSGTIFSNNLNTNGKIGATNDGIYMIGRDIRRQGSITTTNGGSVHLTNSGAITGAVGNTTTISGDYIQDGTGPVSRSGIITAGGTISYLSSITMNHDIGWVAGGSLTLGPLSTLDGAAGSYSVDMSVGGEISLGAAFGSGTRLNVVTVSECTNWISESIRAVSIVQTDVSLTSVKTTFNGDLDTNGSGGINLTGAAFENNANWTAANGSILINNRGVFTSTAGTIQTTGSFNQSGAGSVSIGNTTIQASGVDSPETFAIAFSRPVDITGGVALNNQSGSKDIVFHNTVDSTASQNMSITANTGDVLFEGLVGDSHPLGRITINSAEGVSFIGAKAGILDQVSGTGTTTLTGAT